MTNFSIVTIIYVYADWFPHDSATIFAASVSLLLSFHLAVFKTCTPVPPEVPIRRELNSLRSCDVSMVDLHVVDYVILRRYTF